MDRLPIIHSYTRANAIADGVLLDVTNEAREAGFKALVALTAEVLNACVKWTAENSERQILQHEASLLERSAIVDVVLVGDTGNKPVL